MKKLVIVTFASFVTLLLCGHVMGQNQTLEMSWNGSWNPLPGPTQGPSLSPQLETFQADNSNSFTTTAANFVNFTPAFTVTTSLRNQVYTGYNYAGAQGTVTTGLSFGTQKSEWNDPVVLTQGPRAGDLFGLLGANVGSFGPVASQYKSRTGALAGTIDPDNTQFGTDANGGVNIFSTVEPLREANVDKAGRYLYGELVITFSNPVINPVIHIASLGGSSWYLPPATPNIPGNYKIAYFTTELELQNTNLTSTSLGGSAYFNVTGNKILNSATLPNGDSRPGDVTVNGLSAYGAASGSVQINTGTGSITQLVYKVYVRGAAASDYSFSFPKEAVGAARNPFYGDFWSVSYSLAKPTQQIFGNVYIDPQTSDGDINKSFGLPNDRTNAGGLLYANLISGGNVVATVPISVNGDYAFDNVPLGSYTVQLSSVPGVVGGPQPATTLPANWINTGEFIGAGAGTDGNVNGISALITLTAVSPIKTEVNFGIKAGACPGNLLYINPVAKTGYYGGFELSPTTDNFYSFAKTNLSNGPGQVYPVTPLAAAKYSITTDPAIFNAAYSSFKSLGDQKQMVVNPAANDVVYYLMDSAGINTRPRQTYFISFAGGSFFRGWFANTTATNAIVKFKFYDADVPSRVFLDENYTVTGLPGSWVNWSKECIVNYGTAGQQSLTKKIRLDIISVNGAPFSIDELCFTEAAAGPVPIILADFVVNQNNCAANLVWKTSSESNSDRFEVEVSTGTNPVYSSAGSVLAAGYSSTNKTYQFNYPMQAGVVYYFRLKMIDKDGSFKLSDIRSSSCPKVGGGITIGPNPTTDIFTIRGMETGKNLIVVYGSNGQLVKSQTTSQTQDDVDISHLAPGVYMVKITSEAGNTVISKLIKY